MRKILLNNDVYHETQQRIQWAFDTFPQVCVSFSGGKDSTVLFHLVADAARKYKKTFSVLFIDWEVQFSHTIEHIQKMHALYTDVVSQFYWVALPLTTVSGVSQFQPEWVSWEQGAHWVRTPPPHAITDPAFFPFYTPAMTFESFIPAFSRWLAGHRGLITLTGVRADESLNRYMALVSQRKLRYADDRPWTTASQDGFYYTAQPLYDWKVHDIWKFHGTTHLPYNGLYDLMYRAGVALKHMRVCEPFGPEQRRGLWLYHVLEPETWGAVCTRVSGAQSGARYGNQSGDFYGMGQAISKPDHLSWRRYALGLLDSMPPPTAEHYRCKIAVYLRWYQQHGYPQDIPDSQERDLGNKDIPSWRRICKTLIRNDYWCKTLSFSPNSIKGYNRYIKRIQDKRKNWGLL